MVVVRGKEWELPEADVHQAICCDVIEVGWRRHTFPGKGVSYSNDVVFAWQLEALTSEGKPFLQYSYGFNRTMSDRGNLRKFLSAWRGEPITPQEIADGKVELENYVGKQCRLTTVRFIKSSGSMGSKVVAIATPGRVAPRLTIKGYVRVKDRPLEIVPEWLRKLDERPGAEDEAQDDEWEVPSPGDKEDIPF